jgi:hypothetical protein
VDVASSDAIEVVGVQLEPVQRRTELPVAFEPAGSVHTKSISAEEVAVAETRVGGGGALPEFGQLFTKFVALTLPIPVAKSQPVVVP